MTTEYTHRVTIAVPELLVSDANQLALITGESPHNDQTFKAARYENESGAKYAVCSTVAKESFVNITDTGLPPNPPFAEGADRVGAQRALDAVLSGEVLLGIDTDPLGQLAEWGLTRVEDVEL